VTVVPSTDDEPVIEPASIELPANETSSTVATCAGMATTNDAVSTISANP
jgi:hypothetical protein